MARLIDGDLVVTTSSGSQLHLGKTALVTREVAEGGYAFSNFMQRLRVGQHAEPRYLFYFLNSSVGREQLNYFGSTTTGLRNLNGSVLSRIVLPGAPRDEQRAIADLLDRETEKIDALVAKKRRLIELLHEERTELISHAVTRGLDPEVPTKDSGIEWLGEIPAEWQSGPLRRFWNVIDCKHKTVTFLDEGVPVASIGEVHGVSVDLSNANLTSEAEAEELSEGGRKPRRGDVIISRNATVGEAALVDTDQDFCLGQDVSLIRSEDNDQRYLAYLLQSPGIRQQVGALTIGSTFRRINVGRIKDLCVLRPPRQVQEALGRYCADVSRKQSETVSRVSAAVGVLSEYRSALVTAAVTGQIDVRNQAQVAS
jgi:type I restriction enzyme S subunit